MDLDAAYKKGLLTEKEYKKAKQTMLKKYKQHFCPKQVFTLLKSLLYNKGGDFHALPADYPFRAVSARPPAKTALNVSGIVQFTEIKGVY